MQFISDIHLEFRKTPPIIDNNAEILALLGDIGKPLTNIYKNFIKDMSNKFRFVLVITGNHEYYNSNHTKQQIDEKLDEYVKSLCNKNVYFLNNKSIILPYKINNEYIDMKFIGSTLWSSIKNNSFFIMTQICDYQHIKIYDEQKNRKKSITTYHTNKWHNDAYDYIDNEIYNTNDNIPIIMLSHHSPLNINIIHGEYADNGLETAYSTDLSHLLDKYKYKKIIAWFYGHTHVPTEFYYDKTFISSNPLGYPDENEKIKCNVNKVYNKIKIEV